jgi:hypothetical protein
MNVKVIVETDDSDLETIVIGVASSRETAMEIINTYYGKDLEISNFNDVRDSSIDCTMTVKVGGYKSHILIEDFEVDDK